MSDFIQAIILGIVQGATEFIPVSSSAHLVIVPWLFGWQDPDLLFDTMLHWGTLLSIILVFWRELWEVLAASLQSIGRRSLDDPNARLGWGIVLGTIPAVAAGLLFEEFFEALFASAIAAGSFLFVTAALLTGSELLAKRRQSADLDRITFAQAVVIGLAQALALAPGISRSGSTMAAGLVAGLRREAAVRFSFFLGTPVFFGAGLLQLGEALAVDPGDVAAQVPLMILGFAASAVTGYLAIRWLLGYVRHHTLYAFAAYCVVLGLLVIGLALAGVRPLVP